MPPDQAKFQGNRQSQARGAGSESGSTPFYSVKGYTSGYTPPLNRNLKPGTLGKITERWLIGINRGSYASLEVHLCLSNKRDKDYQCFCFPSKGSDGVYPLPQPTADPGDGSAREAETGADYD